MKKQGRFNWRIFEVLFIAEWFCSPYCNPYNFGVFFAIYFVLPVQSKLNLIVSKNHQNQSVITKKSNRVIVKLE